MFELDPGQINALTQLGALGFFIILTGLWLKRWIITHAEKKESDTAHEARLAEMRADRDAWKQMSLLLTKRISRFQAVLERVTGVQVPADPDDE